ncbi:hypothetical protein RhiirA4_551173 [Rhizophagus irregularis]|uniref:Uncharacterized protein n=1 Tax=Rhizophagus irregularis TaxID=588596 RepID=A0A2I1HTS0_9GLOM|nr:hypothetical protein RhiirA4_551173 [Rhizophagus irregularis]
MSRGLIGYPVIHKDGKVLGSRPKDLVLGPGPQIFRSKFWTRSGPGPKKF